jgi:hypothetical protein
MRQSSFPHLQTTHKNKKYKYDTGNMTDDESNNNESNPTKHQLQCRNVKVEDVNDGVENDESNPENNLSTTTEVEVNFRLDPNGRTLPSDTDIDLPSLDYTTRVISTHFERIQIDDANNHDEDQANSTKKSDNNRIIQDDEEWKVLDDILLDCDIADSCLMPRTFWIDHSMQPRCNLEQMAYDILQHYCPIPSTPTPPATNKCGAEWWVQIRPSPEMTSRYTAPTYTSDKEVDSTVCADADDLGNNKNGAAADTDGISFHWDKDEDLRILCNGTVYVHPHLSTVTYLTSGGDYANPTFIAENVRVHNLTGEWIDSNCHQDTSNMSTPSAFISWPSKGKHLCFDGRYLHAAPSNLLSRSKKLQLNGESNQYMERRQRRYTFLVNIWMYHHPFNVHPFPESMIDKLSGAESNQKNGIRLILEDANHGESDKAHGNFTNVSNVCVLSDSTIQMCESDTDMALTNQIVKAQIEQFIWPMGDYNSNESIHASIPIEILQSKKSDGGSVRIHWKNASDDITGSNIKSTSPIGMFLRKEPIHTNHDNSDVVTIDNNEPDSKRPKCNGDKDAYM